MAKIPQNYNVVLLDDDDHTYQYVIEMLCSIFGYEPEMSFLMACTVDKCGRVIVSSTPVLAAAEDARDRIMRYGRDPRMPRSKGSMRAVIESAL
jgi:ATP-dependent Clp protease adaptor protein ClpS